MKYHATIDISNKNNSHTLAFDAIVSHARGRKLRILEAGCSSGYFGEVLKEEGHEVWGIEPDEVSAASARTKLDQVYTCTIEQFFETHCEAKFDAIVFGDVLEHLLDPKEILKCCKEHLTETGIIVASVPNIAHTAIRAMLLEGRFEYADLGILDKTHLHFFTRNSLIDLLSSAGYKLHLMDSVRLPVEQVNSMCKMNLSEYSILAIQKNSFDMNGEDFQYVVAAKPENYESEAETCNQNFLTGAGVRITALVSNPSATLVDIRIRRQLQKWASLTGGEYQIKNINNLTHLDLAWADIFVLQREANQYVADVIRNIQREKKKIIFDIDDFLLELPAHLSHHRTGEEGRFLEDAIGTADAVSVSSSNLKGKLQRINNHIFVTQNFSEPLGPEAIHVETRDLQAHLIIASSDKQDLGDLIPALIQIKREYFVKIIGIGPIGNQLAESGVELDTHELMSISEFRKFIASFENPIGVIPLDESHFSACKSAIKYFDYSLANIPSICSNVPPYSEIITSRDNGILVNNKNEWVSALGDLISSTELRAKLASNAKELVLARHNLDIAVEQWGKMIESMGIDTRGRCDIPKGLPWPLQVIEDTTRHSENLARDLEALRIEHQAVISDFVNSTSWKITWPIRWLSRKLSSIFGFRS